MKSILLIVLFLLITLFSAHSTVLTEIEKNWIKQNNVVRIAGPKSFPPFRWYDKNNQVQGIAPAYIKALLEPIGFSIQTEPQHLWPEVLKKIENKEIDIISASAYSKKREDIMSFSSPYLSFPMVIINQKKSDFIGGIEDLHHKRVALIKGVVTKDWLAEHQTQYTPIDVNTPIEALKAVSVGKADAYIGNLAAATYLIDQHGLSNLQIAAPTPFDNYNLYISVRKDRPILLDIINKRLAEMPAPLHSEIRSKWLSIRYEHGINKTEIFYWAFGIICVATFIIGSMIYWNRRLKKEIEDRIAAEHKMKDALSQVKTLEGLIPICAHCKNIRDDEGDWKQLEQYITEHSEAEFSHGICSECAKKHYPDFYK